MSTLKKLFGYDSKTTNLRTEILAGITTFLTMSYILAVNPGMFSLLDGMPAGAVFTATALASIVGCLVMAFWGKLPFGLAPGMGLNAFFVFSVCMGMGYSWQFALTAVFIEGLLFILMTITNIREAMLIGILATTLIGIPMGITEFKGVVSTPESIAPIFCQFEWENILTLDMLVVVFTFLFIDMFDTMGPLIGVCTKADMVDKKTGRIPRLKEAFMADAIATTIGAMFGTSTTTTYVESASGVAQGGRSGLTAFVIGCCFIVTLFFSPLFLSIPAAATAPVLILVGLLMIEPITKIDLADFSESIPAFACIIMMPLAYSISDGILTGMILYVVINMVCGNFKKITPTMYILAVMFILKYIFI